MRKKIDCVLSADRPSLQPFLNIIICFVTLILIVISYGAGFAEETLTIGRMKVAIWPEYDDPGALVIYDGKFTDPSLFPTQTSFFIPKGSVISDACSLSPKGQHFCQLYKIVDNEGAYSKVIMRLPYPNFYLSFHTPALNTEIESRRINYTIKANHQVKMLEVDIQQPLRATDFNISPTNGNMVKEKDFNHFKYDFSHFSRGEEKAFNIGYRKQDQAPSVDIKYSRMTGPRRWGSPYDIQRKITTVVYTMFGTGIVGLIGIGWFFFFKSRRKQ